MFSLFAEQARVVDPGYLAKARPVRLECEVCGIKKDCVPCGNHRWCAPNSTAAAKLAALPHQQPRMLTAGI
jgi:hypothetical protein